MIKGIGPVYARKLVRAFGEAVLDTIEQDPERLREVPPELVDEALALELADGAVVADTVAGRPCVFLAGLHRAEQDIAERLRRLMAGPLPWPALDAEKAIPWAERKAGITLAESQRVAVRLALRSKVLVITGGPGVGKTTLVNTILQILKVRTPALLLAAPTGRAAKRLSEATGLEARTLHRLPEADPAQGGFKRDEEHPLEVDLLVVDEVSIRMPLPRSRRNRAILVLGLQRALPRERRRDGRKTRGKSPVRTPYLL
jgi:exodeoxyribonuclease V alpha subunit